MAAHVHLTLDQRIAAATDLLNADKPRQALDVLGPAANSAAAQAHYGFQSRLGNAYMGVVDELVAAGRLGAFLVTADDAGSWLNSTVHAERISCYLGVLGAYGTFLQLLQVPEKRADFLENNGADVLAEVEGGARAGLTHAMIEPVTFIQRICQVNCNQASSAFVAHALESGLLSPNDDNVRSFREVQADVLYQPILAATDAIQQGAQDDGEVPQAFWYRWSQLQTEKLFALPVYRLAQRHASVSL